MKIKIRDTVYDSTKEPIMIILNDKEKGIILGMKPEDTSLCLYPSFMKAREIIDFARIEEEEKDVRIQDASDSEQDK